MRRTISYTIFICESKHLHLLLLLNKLIKEHLSAHSISFHKLLLLLFFSSSSNFMIWQTSCWLPNMVDKNYTLSQHFRKLLEEEKKGKRVSMRGRERGKSEWKLSLEDKANLLCGGWFYYVGQQITEMSPPHPPTTNHLSSGASLCLARIYFTSVFRQRQGIITKSSQRVNIFIKWRHETEISPWNCCYKRIGCRAEWRSVGRG